jgi:cell division septation protein DedD
MAGGPERVPDDRGLSVRHFVLLFLAAVAVCGVFFSLGFLVGYNERTSRMAPVTEHVTAPSPTPPIVNPPPDLSQTATPTSTSAETPAKPLVAPVESKASGAGAATSSPPSSAAPVTKAESPAEAAAPAPPPADSPEVGVGFTVQVAASRVKEDAESLVNILKERGYPVFLVTPEYAHADDNLFRVQVGPFKTHDDAEKVRKQLAAEGFNPFIKH